MKKIYMHSKKSNSLGFTLVEMSIVLVIIGIVIAGVLKGQDLIYRSRLLSVVSDISKYETSIKSFYDKYQEMPGDISNAEDIWGDTITKNGDGNGQIDSPNTAATPVYENFRAWQHLGLASVITQDFTGVGVGAGSDEVSFGINVPESAVNGAAFLFTYTNNDNYIKLTNSSGGGVIEGYEASYLDRQLDDGMPNTGKVRGVGGADCITGSEYNYQNPTKSCSVLFLMDPTYGEY